MSEVQEKIEDEEVEQDHEEEDNLNAKEIVNLVPSTSFSI